MAMLPSPRYGPVIRIILTLLLTAVERGSAQINSEITIGISSSRVTEGDAAATVTLSASNNIINGQVNLIFCGNLVNDDFAAALSTLTPAVFMGTNSVPLTLTFLDDMLVEGTESLHIIIDSVQDLSGSQTFTIGTPKHVVLEVSDNDAEFSFVDATQFVSELQPSIDVYVEASYPVTSNIDITLEVSDLSPTCTLPGGGPADMATFTCTMATGSQYATCPITFSGDGCFGLTLMSVDDMAMLGSSVQSINAASATTTVSVKDSATANQISFEESSLLVDETAGTVDIVVVVTTAAPAVTNIPITLEAVAAGDVAATQFDDFTAESIAIIPKGGSRGTATVTLADDAILECMESIVFGFTTSGFLTAVEPMTTTLYITDDNTNDMGLQYKFSSEDNPSTFDAVRSITLYYIQMIGNRNGLSITKLSYTIILQHSDMTTTDVTIGQKADFNSITVNENDGCFRIGLEADAVSECPYMGSFDICGGTATPNEDIYGACTYQLPSASTNQRIHLCLNDDALQEGPETIYLALNPPASHGTTTQLLTEITINDNEASGGDVIQLCFAGPMAAATITEAGTLTVEIEAKVATSFMGSVTLGYGIGDLTAGDDFTIDAVTLLFDGAITTATATITAVDDMISEFVSESLEIYVTESTLPVDAASATVTLTVTDDDVGVSLFPTTVLAAEGGTVYFVLLLDKPAPAALTNVISETDISTTAADYTRSPASVDLAIGDLSVEFMYVLADSDGIESTEVFEVVAVVGASSVTSTVTIYDESDFRGKAARLPASQYAVLEGTDAVITLAVPGATTPSIVFDESSSTAMSAGVDYTNAITSPLTTPWTLTIDTNMDDVFENNEQAIIVFTNDDVYPQMSAEVTFYETNNQADISCATPTVYVCEKDGVAVVEFVWTAIPAGGTDYDLGILYADGTAEETMDFDAITTSINVMAAGPTATVTATVSILSDVETEPDEELYIYIAHSYTQAPSLATCTVLILDDD